MEGNPLQRKWSIGANFGDECDVDEVLPSFSGGWRSFPPRAKVDVDFQPMSTNQPVGNTENLEGKTLMHVIVKVPTQQCTVWV